MSANSEIILSGQTHSGDSIPKTVTGDQFKGDGFYSRSDGVHTVQYNVIDFVGIIEMQATLAVNPAPEDWFTISSTSHTSTVVNSSESNGSFIKNFIGNYIWVRARVRSWTAGTVSSILLNH